MISFAKRQAKFDEWHKHNPGIWEHFQRFSFQAMHHGHKKISHWLIINRVRWEVFIITTGKDFKISNEMIAFYARLWQKTYPQHKGLFNTKRMIGEPFQEEEQI
jgi:hypothetical protein